MSLPKPLKRIKAQTKVRRAHLHSKALSTAFTSTAEVPLVLVKVQDMVLQVEAGGEVGLTAIFGALEHFLLPGVDMQLVLLQEPGHWEPPLAAITWQHD